MKITLSSVEMDYKKQFDKQQSGQKRMKLERGSWSEDKKGGMAWRQKTELIW